MECPVCFSAWDLEAVRPKGLPCLHSLCRSCLGRLESQECPRCRQAFAAPVPDNFALVALLEAMALERPPGAWWCMDCQSAASTRCLEEHSLRRPTAELRRELQVLVPRASCGLQGLQDGLQGLQDTAALTTLRMLRSAAATCKLSLRRDDGDAFGAEWRVDGPGGEAVAEAVAVDSLLRALVVALAASGRLSSLSSLHQDPGEVPEEALPAAPQPREVPEEALPAALQPVAERIKELDLDGLSQSLPGAKVAAKAHMLQCVQQRGVRRIEGLWCDADPDWSLRVLRSAHPALEELYVLNVREEHLAAVHSMPRLRRLRVKCYDDALCAQPPALPALRRPSTLQWLHVDGLPRNTTKSLLRAHAASLDELRMSVGSVGCKPGLVWPEGCSDLAAFLVDCRLVLSRLVLSRPFPCDDCGCIGCDGCDGCDECDGCDGCIGCIGCTGCTGCDKCDGCAGCNGSRECRGCVTTCRAQRQAARLVLPGCTVACNKCGDV